MTRSGRTLISRFCRVDSAPNRHWFISRQLRVSADNRIRAHVKVLLRILLFCSGTLLAGCGLARTSYHVVTAPVHLFTGHGDKPPEATTTTTTRTTGATSSDVTTPGQPVAPPTPTPTRRRVGNEYVATGSPSSGPQTARKRTEATPEKPSATPRGSPAVVDFPTAKPVPGKPGYVFDPFNPNGGYIDVSGYAPGSKVKDPATKKIFIVP
jgi:hypothetical protein